MKGEWERTGSLPAAGNILARVSRKHMNIDLGQKKGMILLGHLERKKRRKKVGLVRQTRIKEENLFTRMES